MIILTAGNYRFKSMIKTSLRQAKKFGYETAVYDLGDLGFGKSFIVENASFHKKGYYWKVEGVTDRQTRAVHKISVIKDCLNNYSDFTVYLDGDAILVDSIDEVAADYDIGLTVRPLEEVNERRKCFGTTREDLFNGYINAGVMFFNNTKAARRFIDIWSREAEKLKNDQAALNSILQGHFPLNTGQTITLDGVRIRTFDTRIYNFYYFDKYKPLYYATVKNMDIKNAKILHFKNDRRQYYEAYFRPYEKNSLHHRAT